MFSCALFCFKQLARRVPTNYILMFLFTFCEAYLVAFICAAVDDPETVMIAIFMTAGIVASLSIYAIVTKTDFTAWAGMLFVVGAAFILFGLFSSLFGATMRIVYCTLGIISLEHTLYLILSLLLEDKERFK